MTIWGIVLAVAIVAGLFSLYFRMSPMARLNYWMRVRASLPGGARCRECGNRADSSAYPFCSEDHAHQHAATTAW